MNKPKIYAHGSYIGDTGYNQHTRDFFRHLDKHANIKVRNFTVGRSWKGYNETSHDNEHYFNKTDKKLLYKQILWNKDKTRSDYPLYPDQSKEFKPDVNIVLCETNHHIFYDEYEGPKIGYNVWESTLQPQGYFNKLLEFDELWVPSKWQRDCTIAQGYPEDKIKVVPEGVDVNTFYPDDTVTHPLTKDKFTFFVAGRWDYRKSIKEIIETFIKTFDKNEPVELVLSVDNPFSNDGLKTTEERLKHYGLEDDRIKILHFPPREEYIRLLKSCSVFVSCARAEGWNLPLIEAMACGTPSIYSDCSGQLEFAEGNGIPVRISHELPVSASTYNHFNDNVGNYYEPDFNNLGEKMLSVYGDYKKYKSFSLVESEQIREDFSWERIAEIGIETINDFLDRKPWIVEKTFKKNEVIISYLDGPRVEVLGDEPKEYYVEFINKDTDKVVHSQTIKNNMWVACGKKYYIPWVIKINGEVYDELNFEGKTVLISLESKALGDTISWAPYAIEFQKKHNCKVVLSTFKNNFFEGLDNYKDITFIKPGESHGCHAVYRIGWFKKNNKWEDRDRNPNQPNLVPLQQAATDILGLDFKEINHGLTFEKKERPIEKEYVVFGPNATSGCKEWDYNNWVGLSKLIKELGYEVITLTQKPFHIDGVTNIWEEPLDVVANYLYHAKAFVGLGSGLSWFNWGLGNYTFMINGFARPDHEFTTNITKIYNDNTCIFCWNDEVFVFDPGDWDWCPVYKGTKKQHVCQRSITPLQVFQQLITKI
jgi:autotransporter strand-loop-strand O-heptosyltransferase